MCDSYDISYEGGAAAAHAWNTSRQYMQYGDGLPARSVMAVFLPPVPQDLMQISRPLPNNYQAWVRGFENNRER